MDVRWTGRSVDAFEFPCVVAVERSHHTRRGIAPFVEKSREAGEEKPNVLGCFVLVPQHVDSLESGVVIHDDECVTPPPIDGGKEGSRDVYVDEAAGMRRLV
eukprot:4278403-Pleurochrysis_carterae.AAC.1